MAIRRSTLEASRRRRFERRGKAKGPGREAGVRAGFGQLFGVAILILACAGPAFSQEPSATDAGSAVPANPAVAEGADSSEAGEGEERRETWLILPRGELFEPLVADPQWPRFSAAAEWRLGTDEFDRLAAVSFGETFAFVRSPEYSWGEWEFGFQANIDAIFDLTKTSFDLSNEDYFVGFTGSIRTRRVTTQLRIYHISSHLGDEYLIENGGGRDDVSYEAIDLLLSYEPVEWLRLYGGGGSLITRTHNFDPLMLEMGAEVTGSEACLSALLTPFAGVDIQVRQQSDWIPDVAIVTGIRLAPPDDPVRRVELFARYYNGRSPDGQFFRHKVQSLSLGIRLGF